MSAMIPFPVVKAAILGAGYSHADTQYGSESRHRVKATVEPEYEFIQIGWQVLLANAMVSSHQPSLQIREGDVDHREMGIGFLAIAIEHHGLVRLPQLC
jgi:hypothetical protein